MAGIKKRTYLFLMDNKWMTLVVVGGMLAIFGYFVYSKQHTPVPTSQMPVAVAAVRGNTETQTTIDPAMSNAAVNYVNTLQDDVSLAKKRTAAYNAAQQERAKEVQKAAAMDN